MRLALVLVVMLVGCGEDEPPRRAAPRPAGAAPAAAPVAAQGSGSLLVPKKSIEDRVSQCPSPPATKPCDPKLPASCSVVEGQPREYCLETTKGWFCGGCPERDTIRKVLKPRDFAAETVRDPFQSFVVVQPGAATQQTTALPRDVTRRCGDKAVIKIPTYSIADLTLVGVIKLGLQRKVVLIDPMRKDHVVSRNDCVGKERAYVKIIDEETGTEGRGSFVTFEIPPDPSQSEARAPAEMTKYLNANNTGGIVSGPQIAPELPNTPVVSPPGTGAARTPSPATNGAPAPQPPIVEPPR